MTKHKSWLITLIRRLKQWFTKPHDNLAALYDILKHYKTKGLINSDTYTMLECVLALAPMQVRDILLPKTQMISIPLHASLPNIIQTVTESGHSRFPVTAKENDEIIGILHAKDLLQFQDQQEKHFDLYNLLRQATFVPESKRLLTLLNQFRKTRNHMAIVVDEYGEVSGLVTLEDITEQIIGEIEDEFDIDDETFIKPLGNHRFTVKGHTPIALFNETFHTQFSDQHVDTIAGIITSTCGHLPKRAEIIQFHGFQFKVLHADERRIQLLECHDKRSLESAAS